MNTNHFPSFDSKLESLNQFILQLVEEYQRGNVTTWDDVEKRVNDFFTTEQMDEIEKIVPGWQKMSSFGEGVTLTHVMCVFLGLLMLEEYKALSPEQQQLAKWIVLFHDVQKEVEKGKRDPKHGFRSAITAANYLPKIGFATSKKYGSMIHEWSMLTHSAVVTPANFSEPIQDNSKLPEILEGIDKIFGKNTPATLVIKSILLHMSINVVDEWPQVAPLSEGEIAKHIDNDILPLLRVMNLADNEGWTIFYPETRRKQYEETVRAFDKVEKLVHKQVS